jgi:hypothetical protein
MSLPSIWLLILHAWLSPAAHPFYVSVTEVEYDRKAGTMGVSCKFFTDDLEEALKGSGTGKVDLSKGDRLQNQKRIEAYLQAHFRISCGNEPVPLRFLGTEFGPDATWCYLEASGLPKTSSVKIMSDCFYEVRKEQVHIFHLTVDGDRKSRRILNPDKEVSLSF